MYPRGGIFFILWWWYWKHWKCRQVIVEVMWYTYNLLSSDLIFKQPTKQQLLWIYIPKTTNYVVIKLYPYIVHCRYVLFFTKILGDQIDDIILCIRPVYRCIIYYLELASKTCKNLKNIYLMHKRWCSRM